MATTEERKTVDVFYLTQHRKPITEETEELLQRNLEDKQSRMGNLEQEPPKVRFSLERIAGHPGCAPRRPEETATVVRPSSSPEDEPMILWAE